MAKKTAAKPEINFSSAKRTAVKATAQAAEVVVQAAQAIQEHVVTPVVEAVTPTKKARYVRAKKGERAPAGKPLPAPSTKASGRMMSKDLKASPRKPSVSGTKDAKGPKRKPSRP